MENHITKIYVKSLNTLKGFEEYGLNTEEVLALKDLAKQVENGLPVSEARVTEESITFGAWSRNNPNC